MRELLQIGKVDFGSWLQGSVQGHLIPVTWAEHHGGRSLWPRNISVHGTWETEGRRKEFGTRYSFLKSTSMVIYFIQLVTPPNVSKSFQNSVTSWRPHQKRKPVKGISHSSSNACFLWRDERLRMQAIDSFCCHSDVLLRISTSQYR